MSRVILQIIIKLHQLVFWLLNNYSYAFENSGNDFYTKSFL